MLEAFQANIQTKKKKENVTHVNTSHMTHVQ